MKNSHKVGVVLPGARSSLRRTEMFVALVRIQKGGRGKWWAADVTWIDYPRIWRW